MMNGFKRLLLLSFLTFCFPLICGAETAASEEVATDSAQQVSLDQKLERFRADLQKHFSEKNMEGILSLCEPDVVITWQDGTIVTGPEGIKKYYAEKMMGEKSPVSSIEFKPAVESRQVHGDTVISHGRMGDTFTLKRFSQPLEFNSVFTAVLVDKGDQVKLRAAHLSLDAFDNPILTAQGYGSKLIIGIVGFAALVVGLLLGRRATS